MGAVTFHSLFFFFLGWGGCFIWKSKHLYQCWAGWSVRGGLVCDPLSAPPPCSRRGEVEIYSLLRRYLSGL